MTPDISVDRHTARAKSIINQGINVAGGKAREGGSVTSVAIGDRVGAMVRTQDVAGTMTIYGHNRIRVVQVPPYSRHEADAQTIRIGEQPVAVHAQILGKGLAQTSSTNIRPF